MMKDRPYFPLLAKVLGWLLLHLVILALAFAGFVGWQLGLGLDSLLSGSAGERLEAFGEAVILKTRDRPPSEWNAVIAPLARERSVQAAIIDPSNPEATPLDVPPNVLERSRASIPPRPPLPGPRGHPPGYSDDALRGGPPPERGDDSPLMPGRGGVDRSTGIRGADRRSPSSPIFLMRGTGGDGYWAGVRLDIPGKQGQPRPPRLLLVRADGLDGSGMFFEFKPWLWGGLAVLALSLAFWTPFVWGVTRYIRRLTAAADRIAAGHFKVSLPPRGNDELGNLGNAIESMANRLDHLISGQKRFLGDAAHELCAPIARLRTGLGILEANLGDAAGTRLSQIESEAAELAMLVEDILAFSRTGNREPQLEPIRLKPLIQDAVAREGGGILPEIDVPSELTAVADSYLLSRAIGNLIRNSLTHAGPGVRISIRAVNGPHLVEITVADDGPGVPPDEIPRLFEPFYRPDLSRTRETGGSGLGLSIVRSAIEACGGEAVAMTPAIGGFTVILRLRRDLSLSQASSKSSKI